MPHSSGGGSHGGGHHGGSHHSGSRGGSSSNRRHSSSYFVGSRHYVYYKNKRPVHFYSDVKITPEYIMKRKRNWKLIKIGVVCAYLAVFLIIFFNDIYVTPHKLAQTCVDDNKIIDNLSLFSYEQEEDLMVQLDIFRRKTGISVTILTVNDEIWDGHYKSLEKYAYDYYVSKLRDEKNWLIVYSEPAYYEFFNDWKWEGMQGDDTDPVLTEDSTEKFNKVMHKNISKEGFALATIDTFDYYNDIVMKTQFHLDQLLVTIFILCVHGSVLFLVIRSVVGSTIKIDEQAVELADAKASYVEDTCTYCMGLYIHGIHTVCPHCGAPLEPLDRPVYMNNDGQNY